jgi:hypothetical protein
MRLKTLLAALLVAALAVSAAIASPPGKGKGRDKGRTAAQQQQASCKLTGGLNLKGTFAGATVAADGTGSFALQVTKANKHGKAFADKQVTVKVDAKTKYRPKKHAKFADVPAGAKVLVHSRVCKRTTATAAPELLARMVVVQVPADDEGDDESTSTSTSTETATTTAP